MSVLLRCDFRKNNRYIYVFMFFDFEEEICVHILLLVAKKKKIIVYLHSCRDIDGGFLPVGGGRCFGVVMGRGESDRGFLMYPS